MNKILSIVIPVYNKYMFTKSALEDLSKLPDNNEIVIIDNNSSDETQKELENNPRIIYQRCSKNLGFAGACNMGYVVATAPNVLFLNNDIRVKSNFTDWTAPLIEEMIKEALVGPTMGELDNDLNFIRESNSLLIGKNAYMSGWCLGSNRMIWDKLIPKKHYGPFSEEFGLAYFEDTDLSFRAKQLGISFKVMGVPLVHFGKQTSKQLNTHQLYSQARQIFIKKWKNKGSI